MIGIYGLFDYETGECLYVGQSSNIEYRVKRHMWRLKSYSHLDSFTSWFISVGSDLSRLEYRVLDECDDVDSTKNRVEMERFYELKPKFYGKIPSMDESWAMSDETKQKISSAVSDYWEKQGSNTRARVNTIIVCKYCQKEFTSPRKSASYCSVRCVQKGRTSMIDLDLACKMYYSGKTLRDISGVVDVSHVTVRKYLLEAGVILRHPGEKG